MSTMGLQYFETLIYQNTYLAAGNPMFMGLLVAGFFLGIALMSNLRLDGKLLLIVPGFLLASTMMNSFVGLLALFLGMIVYVAIMKVISR